MKIGVKIQEAWEEEFLNECVDFIDFVEIMAVRGTDYSFVKQFGLPVIVHNEHWRWGVNLADPNNVENNLNSLKYSIELADKFNAKYIIVHPELKSNEICSEEQIAKFLQDMDSRIILENMPYKCKYEYFGYDKNNMSRLLNSTKRNFCLDFAHAGEAAQQLGVKIVPFVKKFLQLDPVHFHISDTVVENLKDMHLHIGEGTLPFKQFRALLPNDAWITLEVDNDIEKTKNDITFLRQ